MSKVADSLIDKQSQAPHGFDDSEAPESKVETETKLWAKYHSSQDEDDTQQERSQPKDHYQEQSQPW